MPRNLYKRGNIWYFQIRVGGQRVRKALGDNLVEARRRARILRDHYRGLPDLPPDPLTFARFTKRWVEEYAAQQRIARDVGMADSRLHRYVFPILGDVLLDQVRVEHLRALRSHLDRSRSVVRTKTGERLGGPLSRQSVKHILSDVRCVLRYAVDVGVLRESPWSSRVLPKIPQEEPRRLSDVQVARLEAVLPPEQLVAFRLALLTGMRWGEERNLQWRNVVMQSVNPHLVLGRTKSGKVRRVPLGTEALALLREQRLRTRSVFVLDWRPKQARASIDRARERSGVEWTWHQLRHTFACRWIERGGSIEILSRILGHSSVTTTERYGRASDKAVFAEARQLEKAATIEATAG